MAPYKLITAVSHWGHPRLPCVSLSHVRTESRHDSTHRGRIEARIVTVVLSLIRPRIVEVERFIYRSGSGNAQFRR